MSLTIRSSIIITLGLILTSLVLGGCSTSQEIDRTKRRPHTAMRGPAYTRLILTFNEANSLSQRADQYAAALRESGSADPDTQLDAQELAESIAKFTDDIEWSLANNQRMTWHRSRMDGYWEWFLDLYPEDRNFAKGYTKGDMRSTTPKLKLKNQEEYADLHEYEHHDANWGSLLHPPGEKIYDRQKAKQDTN